MDGVLLTGGAGILALLRASPPEVGKGRMAKSFSVGKLTTGKLLRSDADFLRSRKNLSRPFSLLLLNEWPNDLRLFPGVIPGVAGDMAGAGGTGAKSNPTSRSDIPSISWRSVIRILM